METRKIERLVALISPDDKRRIKRYCDQNNVSPSEFIRNTLLAKVRPWEKRKGFQDAAAS